MSNLKFTLQAILVVTVLPLLVYTNTINPSKMMESFNKGANNASVSYEEKNPENSSKSSFAVYPEIVYPHFITQ